MPAPDGPQIGLHDREVRVLEGLDRLELHDDLSLDEQIELVVAHASTGVADRHRELPLVPDASLAKLNHQSLLVDPLQKAGSQRPVDLDGGPDDPPGEIFVLEHSWFPPFLVS